MTGVLVMLFQHSLRIAAGGAFSFVYIISAFPTKSVQIAYAAGKIGINIPISLLLLLL